VFEHLKFPCEDFFHDGTSRKEILSDFAGFVKGYFGLTPKGTMMLGEVRVFFFVL